MKLVQQTEEGWQYELNPMEADVLQGLLNGFPFTAPPPAQISHRKNAPAMRERAAWLDDALAEHRQELKTAAAKILAAATRKKSGWRLALDAATRETLLQILNDIRVGCWHALGEPEMLDVFTPKTVAEISLQNWTDLAGFFEQSLIELE